MSSWPTPGVSSSRWVWFQGQAFLANAWSFSLKVGVGNVFQGQAFLAYVWSFFLKVGVAYIVPLLLPLPKFCLWALPLLVRCLHMWPFFNPTIEVVTFCLHEWCMLGVFLLPALTCLGHKWSQTQEETFSVVYNSEELDLKHMQKHSLLCMSYRVRPVHRGSSSGWVVLYTTENVSVCAWNQVLHCYIQQRMFLLVLEIKFFTVIYNRECFSLCLKSSSSLLYTTENVLLALEIKFFTVIYNRECFCLSLRSSSSLLCPTENVSPVL